MTNDRKKDLFSADIPLASELSESGINQVVGGKSVAYSGCNAGWVCTVTKDCQRICRVRLW